MYFFDDFFLILFICRYIIWWLSWQDAWRQGWWNNIVLQEGFHLDVKINPAMIGWGYLVERGYATFCDEWDNESSAQCNVYLVEIALVCFWFVYITMSYYDKINHFGASYQFINAATIYVGFISIYE